MSRSLRRRSVHLIAALAASASLFSAGCGLDGGTSHIALPVHAAVEVRPLDGESWHLAGGDVLTGTLVLDVAAPGTEGDTLWGVLSLSEGSRATISEVEARYIEGVVHVESSSISLPSGEGELAWERFELSLEDTTDDGVFDSGAGTLGGELVTFLRPGGLVHGDITASPDTRRPRVGLRSRGFHSGRLFPHDTISARFSKPIAADAVEETLVLLVDGVPTDASISAGRKVSTPWLAGGSPIEVVTTATLTPDAPIPLGAEVSADVSGLVDLSGLAISEPAPTLSAAADLGTANDNLDFAREFDGWHTLGTVSREEAFQGAEPADADHLVVLEDRSRLIGAIEVPETGGAISLDLVAFSEYPHVPEGEIVVDAITFDGALIDGVALGAIEEDDLISCLDCFPFQFRSEPTPLEIDLARAAGDTVFFRVTLSYRGLPGTAHEGRDHLSLSPPLRFAAAFETLTLHAD